MIREIPIIPEIPHEQWIKEYREHEQGQQEANKIEHFINNIMATS